MHKNAKTPDRSQAWVLVVEDDEAARRSLTEILRLEGYQVEQTANTAEAINILQQKSFDVILLDLRMPIENTTQSAGITEEQAGLIVLRFVVKTSPETPVIFLTAHGSLETAIEALRSKAEDYLLKPATPDQILAALDKALWHRQEKDRQRSQAAALAFAKSAASELTQSLEKFESSLQALNDPSIAPEGPALTGKAISSPEQESSVVPEMKNTGKIHAQTVLGFDKGITIDLERREIRQTIHNAAGMESTIQRLAMTPTEGKLMRILLENPGKVFSHRELVSLVQGYETSDQEAPEVLRPLISRLRHKLESFPNGKTWIRSIRGVGYTFEIEPGTLRK